MKGLAGTMAQQQAAPQPQAQGAGQVPAVDEVVAMLMQGASPEELEQLGIPPELIMQAITMVEQQLAAQSAQAPQQQAAPQDQMGGGLASQAIA